MTDKLADALKDAKEFIERMPKGIGRGAASPLYIKIVNALEEYEAAKPTPTPAVQEAVDYIKACHKTNPFPSKYHDCVETLIRAALRQGVTLPREVENEA